MWLRACAATEAGGAEPRTSSQLSLASPSVMTTRLSGFMSRSWRSVDMYASRMSFTRFPVGVGPRGRTCGRLTGHELPHHFAHIHSRTQRHPLRPCCSFGGAQHVVTTATAQVALRS